MKEWVLSVCGMVFLTAVLYSILPQGRTGKIIKTVFALMCLTVLIKPVLNLKDADFDFKEPFSASKVDLQDGYLEFTLDKKEKSLETGIKSLLDQAGVEFKTVVVNLYYLDDFNISTKKVTVQVEKNVIKGEDEHIVIIDKIFVYLSSHVLTDKNLIEIYE